MTGPKVSQHSFDLSFCLFPKRKRERNRTPYFILNSVLASSGTCLYATTALNKWYSWSFVITPPSWYTWPYSETLCVQGLNVLRSKGRQCCSGWSSLVGQTSVKEVVLHLPEGHLRHISYIIIHTVWTSSRWKPRTERPGLRKLSNSLYSPHLMVFEKLINILRQLELIAFVEVYTDVINSYTFFVSVQLYNVL